MTDACETVVTVINNKLDAISYDACRFWSVDSSASWRELVVKSLKASFRNEDTTRRVKGPA